MMPSITRASWWHRALVLLALLVVAWACDAPMQVEAQTTALQSGVPVSAYLSYQTWKYYSFNLLPGASLSIYLQAVSGDPDLYVANGYTPTRSTYGWQAGAGGSDSLAIPSTTSARNLIIGVYAYSAGTHSITATASITAVITPISYGATAANGTQGYSYYSLPAPSAMEDVILTLNMTSISSAHLYARADGALPSSTFFTWSSTRALNATERIIMSQPSASIIAVYITSARADFVLSAQRVPHVPMLSINEPVAATSSAGAQSLFYFTSDGNSSFVVSVSTQYPASTQILLNKPTSVYDSIGPASSDASAPMGTTSLEVSGALLMPGTYTIAVLTAADAPASNSFTITASQMTVAPASGSYLTLSPSSLQSVTLTAGAISFYSITVAASSGVIRNVDDLIVTLVAQTGDARLFVRHIDAAVWEGMSSAPQAGLGGSIGTNVVLPSITGGTYVIGVWALTDATVFLTAVTQSSSPQLLLSDARSVWTYSGHPTYFYFDVLSARHPVTISITADSSLTNAYLYVSTPASTSLDGYPRPAAGSSDTSGTSAAPIVLSDELLMPGRYWLAVTTTADSTFVSLTVSAGVDSGLLSGEAGYMAPLMPADLRWCLVPKGSGAIFLVQAPARLATVAQLRLTVGSSVAPPSSTPGGLRVLPESALIESGKLSSTDSLLLRVDRSAADTAECMRLASPQRSDGCLYTLEVSGVTTAGVWSGSGLLEAGSQQSTSISYALGALPVEATAALESTALADAASVMSVKFDDSWTPPLHTLAAGRTHHFAVVHNNGYGPRMTSVAHLLVELPEGTAGSGADGLGVYVALNASQTRLAGAGHFDFMAAAYGHAQLRLALASDATPTARVMFTAQQWYIAVTNNNPSSVTYTLRIGVNDTAWQKSGAGPQSHAQTGLTASLAVFAMLAAIGSVGW